MRKWLFFEIEPFVVWLDKEDFEPSYGIALRFEAFYGEGAHYQFQSFEIIFDIDLTHNIAPKTKAVDA